MTQGYSGGEAGYIGIATQYDPQGTVAAPTTAPTAALVAVAGLIDNGTHAYVKTDVTALGESLPSAVSNVVTTSTSSNGQVSLTTVAVGSTGVTSRKIYRSKAGTGATGPFYLLTTLANNTATTFTDNVADASLGAVAPTVGAQNGAPGVFVAPTQFLMAESDTLDSQPAQIVRDVFGGSRDSDQGHRTGKYTTGGQVGLGLYPDNGFPIVVAGIGKDTLLASIASDTTTALATAAGISTGTLSSGAGAYVVGQPILLDADASGIQEPRQVLSWNSGTKQFTTAALTNAHAAVGTTVVGPATHQVSPYANSDAAKLLLRFLSVEQNIGGKYSQRYADCMVGKLNLKGAAAKFELQADIVANADRKLANGIGGNPAATSFSQDSSWTNLSFEFTDGFGAFSVDPTDSGTASLQLVTDMMDWELDINNNMKPTPTFDNLDTIRNFPMKREVTLKFSLLNQASRPVAWTDFVTQNKNMAWFAQAAFNYGTSIAPDWRIFCIYIPALRFTKATPIHGLTDIVGESIEAVALKTATQEKLYIFYKNSFATAI